MPETTDPWPERIRATSSGLKDVLLALAAIATIWIQRGNEGKLDTAAVKAEIAATKATEADKTSANNYAITAKWWADKTGDPKDMAKAEQAQERLEAPPP